MKRLSQANRRRHFTLVEMVVAMAVLVVVALILGTASAAFYNGYQRSVRVTERLKTCQTIDRVMDRLVRNLVPFEWEDELNSTRLVFEGEPDSLHFVTLQRTYGSDRGAFLFVRIRVEGEELIAEYSSYPRLPWEEQGTQDYSREVLATQVRSVSFLYAEEEDDEIVFENSWVEEDHESTPLAIQMTVEWLDGTTEQWLRRTAGSSSNSTFGRRETPML